MSKKIGMKIATYGIVLVLAVSIFAGLSTIVSASEQQPVVNYTTRAEIYIWDNDYTVGNGVSSGNGTEGNPYIIENWEIDGSTTGYAIDIEESDEYCIIRDCYIYGARDESESSGVLLWDCENIIIENCTIDDNDVGILVMVSENILIDDNNLDANGVESSGGGGEIEFTGIDILTSENITVSNNLITNENTTSIRIYNSVYCMIEQNTILNGTGDGIDIARTSYSIIRNNYVAGCLRGLYGVGQQYDKHCEYNTVYNNSFINNVEVGIFMYNTENNTFYFNNIIGNQGTVTEYNSGIYNGEYYSNVWWANYNSKNVGNYYDDYTGADVTGDGIGEEAYAITDTQPVVVTYDYYPLTEPYNGTLPTEPATWSEDITNLLLALMPFIIMLMIIKNIHGWMDKGFKTKK